MGESHSGNLRQWEGLNVYTERVLERSSKGKLYKCIASSPDLPRLLITASDLKEGR